MFVSRVHPKQNSLLDSILGSLGAEGNWDMAKRMGD